MVLSASTKPAYANWGDGEAGGSNSYVSTSLDVKIASPTETYLPDEPLTPGDSATRDYILTKAGALNSPYRMEYVYTSGDAALCNTLDATITHNWYDTGGAMHRDQIYAGKLSAFSDFSTNSPTHDPNLVLTNGKQYYANSDYSQNEHWLSISLGLPESATGSTSLKTCAFDFRLTAWQTEIGDASGGFFDIETIGNTVSSGDWLPPTPPVFWVEEDTKTATLEWFPSPESDTAGYRIYRSIDQVSYPLLKELVGIHTSFIDDTPGNKTPFDYYYKVTAYDTYGNENEVSAIVPKFGGTREIVIDDDSYGADYLTSGTITKSTGWNSYNTNNTSGAVRDVLSFAVGGDNYSTHAYTDQTFGWKTNAILNGYYDIYVSYICDDSRGIATYDIYSGTLKVGSVTVDQSKKADGTVCGSQLTPPKETQHKLLGTFRLVNASEVRLSSATGNYILADAVMFQKTGETEVGLGDVVINEIMWMGSTYDPNDEWIELRNMSGFDIDLGKWEIVSGKKHADLEYRIPSDKKNIIPANGYFLISNWPMTAHNTALAVDGGQNSAGLSFDDVGEQLVLLNKDGIQMDITPLPDLYDPTQWAKGELSGELHKSMERNLIPGDGLLTTSWHTCSDAGCNDGIYWKTADGPNYGTPGAANLSSNDPTSPDYIGKTEPEIIIPIPEAGAPIDEVPPAILEKEVSIPEPIVQTEGGI